MPFADDCADELHAEPEQTAVKREHIAIELNGPDAQLVRLLGERHDLQPASIVRIALITLASEGRRW